MKTFWVFLAVIIAKTNGCLEEFKVSLLEEGMDNIPDFMPSKELLKRNFYEGGDELLGKLNRNSQDVQKMKGKFCKIYAKFEHCLMKSIKNSPMQMLQSVFKYSSFVCPTFAASKVEFQCLEAVLSGFHVCWKQCGEHRSGLRKYSVNDLTSADMTFYTLNGKAILYETCSMIECMQPCMSEQLSPGKCEGIGENLSAKKEISDWAKALKQQLEERLTRVGAYFIWATECESLANLNAHVEL